MKKQGEVGTLSAQLWLFQLCILHLYFTAWMLRALLWFERSEIWGAIFFTDCVLASAYLITALFKCSLNKPGVIFFKFHSLEKEKNKSSSFKSSHCKSKYKNTISWCVCSILICSVFEWLSIWFSSCSHHSQFLSFSQVSQAHSQFQH